MTPAKVTLAVAALTIVLAASLPVQASDMPAPPPISVSRTDDFSKSFAACDAAGMESHASLMGIKGDVLDADALAPCCACVDVTGTLICQCNAFPCACTPLATGQCRCVCGPVQDIPGELVKVLCQEIDGPLAELICTITPESAPQEHED